jgi:hypothetical protein
MQKSIRSLIKQIVDLVFEHLPEPWGVLYCPPNKDGSTKMCQNCFMWSKDQHCLIHDKQHKILPNQVCGYHVPGEPLDAYVDRNVQPVDPGLSGLIMTKDGASCDTCLWFEYAKCMAVIDKNCQPAKVHPKGCCARWELK